MQEDTGESPMSPTSNFKKGFSLIELSVALVVMGLLTAVAIPITLSVTRNQKIRQAESELENIRGLIISSYNVNGKLPSHDATYTLPTAKLGIPDQYKNDPIKGIPYLYYADTVSGSNDTIYVDGIPLGGLSAVIISAGPNGKFDGENATPGDRRFASTGTGDFDDVLYYVCELDLAPSTTNTSTNICNNYTLIVRNKNQRSKITEYGRVLSTTTTNFSVAYLSSYTLTGISPVACIQLSPDNTYQQNRTYWFNIATYNEGSDCTVEVVIYTDQYNVAGSDPPAITRDLYR
ncbi:MAG: type II secretion system protein [candidate division WOR-3 bacterium]